MDKVFEIALHVSTPLSLAGIFAAVFFFVIKKILQVSRTKILDKEHLIQNNTIIRIINQLFILALFSMFLGFCGWIIQVNSKPSSIYSKTTLKFNLYDTSDSPLEGVKVTADNVGASKYSDRDGMVKLDFDTDSELDSLHLVFKLVSSGVNTQMTVALKNFPKKFKLVTNISKPTTTTPKETVKKENKKPVQKKTIDLEKEEIKRRVMEEINK